MFESTPQPSAAPTSTSSEPKRPFKPKLTSIVCPSTIVCDTAHKKRTTIQDMRRMVGFCLPACGRNARLSNMYMYISHVRCASRHSRCTCRAQVRASGLADARNLQSAFAKHAHTHNCKQHHHTPSPASTIIPGTMQQPGIRAQQMQRTGTRASGCRSGTGQTPLAEHAQHATQPRSIVLLRRKRAVVGRGHGCGQRTREL